MKISKREKILLIFALVLGLGAIYYFYFLNPFLADMREIAAKTAEKESKIQVLTIQNTQNKILDEQIKELETKNAELLKTIPTGYNQSELIVYLHDLINQYGKKTSYLFEEPEDLVKLDNSKATLSFNTSYEGLKAILLQLNTCRFNNRITIMTVMLEEEKKSETKTTNKTTKKTSTASTTKTTATASTTKYPLQVLMVMEFYNLKGEADIATPAWIIDNKGKTNLFS
jgi:Tfp pilus assembly protein PilO